MLSFFSPKNAKIDGSGQVEPESSVHASPAGICDLGFYGRDQLRELRTLEQALFLLLATCPISFVCAFLPRISDKMLLGRRCVGSRRPLPLSCLGKMCGALIERSFSRKIFSLIFAKQKGDIVEQDAIFQEEQQALTNTYEKLTRIAEETTASLGADALEALGDRKNLFDELKFDLGNGVNLETYAEAEALQRVIDQYNLAVDLNSERLAKTRLLMNKPYFAKVVLQLRPGAPPRELYLGATGMTDERGRHFIIDWRAPVAETYYNQANGKTSYVANGRTIEADLLLRRQFDITQDTLNAYFDTTVAIEDPLLLASLAKSRSSKLGDITATIQREQNQVVRHEDVPVLLVNGIAGSGKTSVMLQRIAYLLYQERDTLRPDDVHLISPNPVFRDYIDNVLPNMGERNPQIETWDDLMRKLGLTERGLGKGALADDLLIIDEKLESLELTQKDFQDICVGDERVVAAGQAFSAYQQYKRLPAGQHRCNLAKELLHERLEQRIASRMHNADVQAEIMDLDEQEHIRLFGHQAFTALEEELPEYTRLYLEDRYAAVADAIEEGAWLRFDRIGMNMLGKSSLSAVEWLYLKLALAGGANRGARYVMVDEVQDYSLAQLMVMARYFCNAHFLLLGDENQAIKEGTATFSQIEQGFAHVLDASVELCRLQTSYRSSPEITALFKTLMNGDSCMDVASVQRPGNKPVIKPCATDEEYFAALRDAVAQAAEDVDQRGLAAIVVADKQRARWMEKKLAEFGGCTVTCAFSGAGGAAGVAACCSNRSKHVGAPVTLPEHGVVLLDLPTAKGLEFDQVIIADAQESVYGADDLSRHRLYTAISRATQKVTILSQGALSPLLQPAFQSR